MRTTRLIACLTAVLAASPAFAVTAGARPAPAELRVTGVAGSSYWVDVVGGVQLANADSYSTSKGSWSGIGLVKPSRHGDAQVFVALDLPQSVRCAGGSCPWTVPPPDLTSDAEGALTAGRYRLVLLGERGRSVSVALRPLNGRLRLVGRAPAVPVTAAIHSGTAVAAHQVQLHAFDSMPGGHGFAVAWSVQYESAEPAGALQSSGCVTDGPTDTTASSVGGVAACGDLQGFDFMGPTSAGLTSVDGSPGYAPVNASAIGIYGPQDSTPIGVGWDAAVVAPTAYLGDVFVGFAVPF
jgi:hypothetical protein